MSAFDYIPDSKQLFQLDLLKQIATNSDTSGLKYWITGGYAYDVLYGELTRDHGDFDFFVHSDSENGLNNLVEDLGFQLHKHKYKEDTQTTLYVYYLGELKLEFVLIREIEDDYFFGIHRFTKDELPLVPIGSLDGVKIMTPTFKAHQRLDQLVDRGSYAHQAHRDKLIQLIEQKQTASV